MGPNRRGEDGGHGGVYVWESVCAQQGKGATAEGRGLNAERKALDRLRKPHIENACTENTPTHTLRFAVTIRAPPPVTPASAAARKAVRNPLSPRPSQVALGSEWTGTDCVPGRKHDRRRRTRDSPDRGSPG